MKTVLASLAVVLLSTPSLSLGVESSTQVQIALYPYYHDPESAWRVTVLADGTVRYEESTTAVKVRVVTRDDATQWVERSAGLPKRLSARKLNALVTQLRALDLGTLRFGYSAAYEFAAPTADTTGPTESGRSYEVSRIVTHGATYRLSVALDGASVDSSVYAPFAALEWQNPVHPDRAAIATIVAAWYHVLKIVGPVNGLKAKMFRPGIS
jgi:hypothetical protein